MRRNVLEAGSEPFPGFRLHELRGRGGFAEVWSATNPQGEAIALKFFANDKVSSTVKEVKSLTAIQKLQHAYLLPMYQVWSVPGYVVVAMELADGSLLELLDAYQAEYRTPIDGEILCRYLTQAADAIDFLNKQDHPYEGRRVGWQHCDIKPSNIVLVGDGVKVCDFGLSKPTTGPLTPYASSGTLDFAAPEIHRNMVSERSDQYSLAVTYYYLRTGKFPFPPPPPKFDRQYSYCRPAPNLALVSAPEQRALERALRTDPADRWANCSILMRSLHEALVNGGSSLSTNMYAPTGSY